MDILSTGGYLSLVSMARTLVIDFDGTVCVGDDPVWSYARQITARLDETHAAAVVSALESYLSGNSGDRFADGYSAVQILASEHLTSAELSHAYLASRDELASGALRVAAPDGLRQFLIGLPARAVLVTNAPMTGIAETVHTLGLDGVFDEIITNADKPAGLRTIVEKLLDGATADTLMSIGDIWVNDLRVPHQMGCATAHIDRFGRGGGTPDLSAPSFEALYPQITQWVRRRLPGQ